MGTIVKRKNGKHQARWYDADGHRRGETFTGRSAAQRALRRFETEAEEIRAGLRDPRKEEARRRTFGELAAYWLEHRTAHKRSPREDRSILRVHLLPAFADTRLCELDTPRIDALRSELLASGRAANTVKNVLNVLSAMLTKAKKLGWIADKPEINRPKPDPLDYNWIDSLDGVHAFLRAAREEEERLPLPGLAVMYATSVFTGVRQGEVAALRWTAVDLDARLITVAHSFTKTTKTQHIRRVPVLDSLLPLLREWRLRCPLTEGDWVFPNTRGKMHAPSARVFKSGTKGTYGRVLGRAGVTGHHADRRLTYHDLRHYPDHRIIPRRWCSTG